ncbi:MAG: adenylosuccinate lyase, partial [Planctomycetota bacterium]
EAVVRHDVIAFVSAVAEKMPPELGRWVHYGCTSYDIVDTALGWMLKRSMEALLPRVVTLRNAAATLARAHVATPCIGRTHGVHAEPTAFGHKMAVFVAALDRSLERLERARDAVCIGKLSGAVGSFAHLDPGVEAAVCERLGLAADPVSTQVVNRDRHAELLSAMAICGSVGEQMALEVRLLARTETREAQEPFAKGQKGSSAMPHKRNPVNCEKVCGLSRLLRGFATTAMENVALWHERDISHSSVERVILPDAFCTLAHILDTLGRVYGGLVVFPERMQHNLDLSGGFVYSGQVLLALVRTGVTREEAYSHVQAAALAAADGNGTFQGNLEADAWVTKLISTDEIAACFDLQKHLKHVPAILERVGIA